MSLAAATPTNATEYTVSEISGALKRSVEDAFGNVRVRGEISGYRGPHSSGHAYFALKDDRAKLDAVVWKTTMARLRFRPEEGMEVIATGRLTTFPGKSSYQIVIDRLEPAGAGALMALLEERKRKLQAEGLFDASRKRKLPFMPCVIGVITSPTGSVIRDIIHRIKDRFPLHVLVWPVRVQGETAGAEAAAAVTGFNALPAGGAIRRPDVLIVARGGGSLEDLWGFNDEALARAVAASSIPVISAVGHETDWTLIDYAADVRAPTPTGAAEIAVPVRAELEATVSRLAARLRGCVARGNQRRRQEFRQACRALPSPEQLMELPRRRLDEATSRLERGLAVSAQRKRARLAAARLLPSTLKRRLGEARRHFERSGERLPKCVDSALRTHRRHFEALRQRSGPEALTRQVGTERKALGRLAERLGRGADCIVPLHAKTLTAAARRLRLEPILKRLAVAEGYRSAMDDRLGRAVELLLSRQRGRLEQGQRMLGSLSYHATLRRGFAVVRDAGGEPVSRADALTPGDHMTVQFADGTVAATAEGPGGRVKPLRPARPKSKLLRPGSPSERQGSLF